MSDKFTLELRRNGQKVPPSQIRRRAILLSQLSTSQRYVLTRAAQWEMSAFLNRVKRDLKRKHSTPYTPGARPMGDGLFKRSGEGLAAIEAGEVKTTEKKIEARFRLPKHLAQQEFGGVITAKGGRYLAIPLPAALDANGLPLRFSPRHWHGTFALKNERGYTICTKRNGRIVPIYALRRSVRIPARLGMREELREEAEEFRSNLQRKIRNLLRDAE